MIPCSDEDIDQSCRIERQLKDSTIDKYLEKENGPAVLVSLSGEVRNLAHSALNQIVASLPATNPTSTI